MVVPPLGHLPEGGLGVAVLTGEGVPHRAFTIPPLFGDARRRGYT